MGDRKRRKEAASVWLTPERRPGPPVLSRRRIVSAAVGLLDEEGLSALSMRRIAARLDASHMSLYWHVPTKGALLELVLDEVFGEVATPPEDLEWSARLRLLADGLRAMFARHRWATRLIGEYPNIGPNALRVSDAALRICRGAGLSPDQTYSASALVLEYVCGFAVTEARLLEQVSRTDTENDEPDPPPFLEISKAVSAGLTGFASLRELAERDMGTAEQIRDRNFAFGLRCILAGLQAIAEEATQEKEDT